jgi:hypothetical protein
MSIQQFYTAAQNRDFARVFQFRLVSFGNIQFDPTTHLVYVESASLPGRQITNVPVPYMGLSFNVPGTASYPGSAGYNVTFRCDQNYNLRSALEAALFNAFDEANSTGDYNIPTQASTLTMELLNKTMDVVRSYKLFGVYVQSLQDAAYNVTDTGTVQTIQASLAYQFWRAGDANNLMPDTDMIPNNISGLNGSPFITPTRWK